MKQDKRALRQSILVALVIMAFAVAAFVLSLPMPGDAPIFPRIASGFLFLCGLGLLLGTLRRHQRGESPETPAVDFSIMGGPAVVLGLVALYALGLKYIGFYVTTLVITLVLMLFMGIRSLKTLVLVTVILLAFLYWLFTIQLGVPMPITPLL